MFSLLELKTVVLDQGIPGVSPLHMALLFLLMFGVSMIPYALLYLSLRQNRPTVPEAASVQHGSFAKLAGWMHGPQPLHH